MYLSFGKAHNVVKYTLNQSEPFFMLTIEWNSG